MPVSIDPLHPSASRRRLSTLSTVWMSMQSIFYYSPLSPARAFHCSNSQVNVCHMQAHGLAGNWLVCNKKKWNKIILTGRRRWMMSGGSTGVNIGVFESQWEWEELCVRALSIHLTLIEFHVRRSLFFIDNWSSRGSYCSPRHSTRLNIRVDAAASAIRAWIIKKHRRESRWRWMWRFLCARSAMNNSISIRFNSSFHQRLFHCVAQTAKTFLIEQSTESSGRSGANTKQKNCHKSLTGYFMLNFIYANWTHFRCCCYLIASR